MRIIAALILALTVTTVSASDCFLGRSRTYGYSYNYTPYYATPVLLADYGYHASYSVGYAADSSDILKAFHDDAMRSKDETIATLKAALASGSVPPELKAAMRPPHPGALAARTDCARCHSAEDGGMKGGKRVFFTAGAFSGTVKDLEAMRDAVESGTMPRDRKWTDKQKSDFAFWLTRVEIPAVAESPKTKELPK